jgi:alpha-L-rhamnosidase
MIQVLGDDDEAVMINSLTPRFSWIVNDSGRAEIQTAYEIEVATTEAALASSQKCTWSSGQISGGQSVSLSYAGSPLEYAARYFWHVRTWNREGEVSPFSKAGIFITPLKDDQWTAQPIWSPSDAMYVFLRQVVSLPDKPIESAIAYVTGRHPEGKYPRPVKTGAKQYTFKFYVNGTLLGIGPCRGGGAMHYNAFDLTQLLHPGDKNVIASIDKSTRAEKDFLCQIIVRFTDGTQQTLSTDATWKTLDATSVFRPTGNTAGKAGEDWQYYYNPYEQIDGGALPDGWLASSFDDSAWPAAAVHPPFPTKPSDERNLFIRPMSTLTVTPLSATDYQVNLGVAACGWLKLHLPNAPANSEFKIVIAPYEESKERVLTWRTGPAGDQTLEEFGYDWRNTFKILGYQGPPLTKSDVQFVAISGPFDETAAHFESSEPLLNSIFQLCKNSAEYDILDVYVDCPTRQRTPFPGDGIITLRTNEVMSRDYGTGEYSIYTYLGSFYPTFADYNIQVVNAAWLDYVATGDLDFIRDHWEELKKRQDSAKINYLYTDHLLALTSLADYPFKYRDNYTPGPPGTPDNVINAWNFNTLNIFAKMADALGKAAERDDFLARAKDLAGKYNTAFWDAQNFHYVDAANQPHAAASSSFFPAAFGLVPPDRRDKVASYLVAKGMACGVYGAQWLFDALYELGQDQAALDLLLSHGQHSYYNMIQALGATTACETWDDPKCTTCHTWGSAAGNIIAGHLMGIEPLTPGFGTIAIHPHPGNLAWAKIDVPTIRGPVHEEFESFSTTGRFTMRLIIPANVHAQVSIPAPPTKAPTITVDGTPTWKRETFNPNAIAGIDGATRTGDCVLFPVGSGEYTFAVNPN